MPTRAVEKMIYVHDGGELKWNEFQREAGVNSTKSSQYFGLQRRLKRLNERTVKNLILHEWQGWAREEKKRRGEKRARKLEAKVKKQRDELLQKLDQLSARLTMLQKCREAELLLAFAQFVSAALVAMIAAVVLKW